MDINLNSSFISRVSPKEIGDKVPPGSEEAENIAADPLEPWSTSDIKDMNAILAWKEPGPDDSL